MLGLRRYPEAIRQTELSAARFPNQTDSYTVRAQIQSLMDGSSEPMKSALRDYGSSLTPWERIDLEVRIASFEGRYLDATRLMAEYPEVSQPLRHGFYLGCLYHAAGDTQRAEENFRQAQASRARAAQARSGARLDDFGTSVAGAFPIDARRALGGSRHD